MTSLLVHCLSEYDSDIACYAKENLGGIFNSEYQDNAEYTDTDNEKYENFLLKLHEYWNSYTIIKELKS